MRRKFGFADDDMVFCFCGRLGKEKNITLLLEYWAKNVRPEDKIKLFILGDGPCTNSIARKPMNSVYPIW